MSTIVTRRRRDHARLHAHQMSGEGQEKGAQLRCAAGSWKLALLSSEIAGKTHKHSAMAASLQSLALARQLLIVLTALPCLVAAASRQRSEFDMTRI
eukprot:6188418-Pleurochrysis_carterae.AAC.5